MKILLGYPPAESARGAPTLSQNRQFQWFSNPSLMFPVVMASGATMLKEMGHEVLWVDAIAEAIGEKEFLEIVKNHKPDIFAFETKTPVIKKHWRTADRIKEICPSSKVVIMGDHVTARPLETMENSRADFVLQGGDYDFMLRDLVLFLENKAAGLPKGVYYREGGNILSSGRFRAKNSLDDTPLIDRELTKWWLYQREYNLMGRPYFYIMSARDCWWGKCSFCAWTALYPEYRARSVDHVLKEIDHLVQTHGAREIFDDAGTILPGAWLHDLCNGLIEGGYDKKLFYSCNIRAGVLRQTDYLLMKKAGFRLVKLGLESANQYTLDRLGKGVQVEDIIKDCEMAQRAGLTVHLTVMIGYPWETLDDAARTFRLAKRLMQKGLADLLQVTLMVPYPGTSLWDEACRNGWLLIDHRDYDRYDMSEPVLAAKESDPHEVARLCGKIYTIFLSPSYLFQRIKKIRTVEEFLFNVRGMKAVAGHLADFMINKRGRS